MSTRTASILFWAKLYEGKGVEAAIIQGGYFMAKINSRGIPAGVERDGNPIALKERVYAKSRFHSV